MKTPKPTTIRLPISDIAPADWRIVCKDAGKLGITNGRAVVRYVIARYAEMMRNGGEVKGSKLDEVA